MQPVLTITLNPALDVTTSVETLVPRGKLRCAPPRYDLGGGGINVSRMIAELGGESTAFVALAGATGEQLHRMLADAGIETARFPVSGETRISFKVMETSSNRQFRFVLPGPEQDAAVEAELFAALEECLNSTAWRYVVASGSLPPGLSQDVYGRLAVAAESAGARFVLDTSGTALRSALAAKSFLIKADHDEVLDAVRAFGPGSDSPEDIADMLLGRGAAEVVVLTLGAEGALMATSDTRLRIRPPEVEVKSTVGAGDSFVAALVYALADDWPLEEACRYGVASAAAAVTTEATELAHKADVEALYADMRKAGS